MVEGDVLGHKNRALVAFQKGSGVGLVVWVSPGCLERFGYIEDRLLLLKGAAFIQQRGWFCEMVLPAQWSLHLVPSQEKFLHC